VSVRAVALLLWLVSIASCKDRNVEPGSSAASVESTWKSVCDNAIRRADKLPAHLRLANIVEACPVCDWKTILAWSTPPDVGGPPMLALDVAMRSCHAFCNATAHDEFFAGLEEARGERPTRTPWRYLLKNCPTMFAGGDAGARYAGAPWLALSKIAASSQVQELLLATSTVSIHLPLPLWSEQGSGLELPIVDGSAAIEIDATQPGQLLTITAGDVQSSAPIAAVISSHGIEISTTEYPGQSIKLDDLATQYVSNRTTILVAPNQLLATRLAQVADRLPRSSVAVITTGGIATWPVPSLLRGDLMPWRKQTTPTIIVDIATSSWAMKPGTQLASLPAAATLRDRIVLARSTIAGFATEHVMFTIAATTTVGEVVQWVAALSPQSWTIPMPTTPVDR
jgi:hypothetical protein